jgi:hypothetical protein
LVSRVDDAVDARDAGYGVYYNKERPLVLAATEGILEISGPSNAIMGSDGMKPSFVPQAALLYHDRYALVSSSCHGFARDARRDRGWPPV